MLRSNKRQTRISRFNIFSFRISKYRQFSRLRKHYNFQNTDQMRTIFFLLLLCACANAQETSTTQAPVSTSTKNWIHQAGKTINSRLIVPDNFQRVDYAEGTFGHYLQSFPLQAHGSKVLLYNGEEKYNQAVHVAVLDMDIGTRDLQQCADAVMRLRAEYLWQKAAYDDIHFNFTNGFRADYSKWRAGNRIRVQGNEVTWVKRHESATSYQAFKKYLTMVFAYAGTLSLEKELKPRPLAVIEVGDVFIQGGSPGHAVLVVDKVINPNTGKQLFCLAQSYMPAQSIHILKNPNNAMLSPWYALDKIEEQLATPEWTFSKQSLKRF